MKLATKLLFTLLLSSNAYAVTNGTSVNWNDYQDMVEMDCTGTVIAGKFILTAAHCTNDNYIRFSDSLSSGSWVSSIARIDHDDSILESAMVDVSLWTLPVSRNSTQIHYFADLTQNTVKNNDSLRLFGFGGTTAENNPLNYATVKAYLDSTSPQMIDGKFNNQGDSSSGDSGGAWLNQNDEIVAIHNSGHGNTSFGTNLHYAKDFILDNINGWHYPTLANTSNGTATITVQSLHQNNVADNATTSGDAQIIGGTCLDQVINPYEKCTYIIESQGGIGTIHLSGNESIAINKPTPTPESGGGDSGGSLGFLSLIGLLGLGLIRKK